jgi:hypothetical protein
VKHWVRLIHCVTAHAGRGGQVNEHTYSIFNIEKCKEYTATCMWTNGNMHLATHVNVDTHMNAETWPCARGYMVEVQMDTQSWILK